jgi:hypothetical protein
LKKAGGSLKPTPSSESSGGGGSAPPLPSSDGRGALLAQIQAGKRLKKTKGVSKQTLGQFVYLVCLFFFSLYD